MIVKCAYGIGDTACVLPKLASLAMDKRIDHLTYHLTGYYPHLLYRLLINFDFNVQTRYILSPIDDGSPEVDRHVIEAHPQKIDQLPDIPDIIIPEKYLERFQYLGKGRDSTDVKGLLQEIIEEIDHRGRVGDLRRYSIDCLKRLQASKSVTDIILSKFLRNKQTYRVVFHPYTSLRTPRNFEPKKFAQLFESVMKAFGDSDMCLVGTHEDYLKIRDVVDTYVGDNVINNMGLFDVAENVQAVFDAEIVIGVDSWVSYLAAMLDKRSAMYILGGMQVEQEFQNRIVSRNFYGFDNISLRYNLKVDDMIEFLKE